MPDDPITLLYTHNLRGDLTLLPRLFTFIRQLKALRVDDENEVMLCEFQPQTRRTLLVDVGNSCAPDQWHCAATGGRSVLVALDAMGYDAAHVTGQISAETREKLESTVSMALVDAAHPYRNDGVTVSPARLADERGLQIVMQPGEALRLEGRALYPAALTAGQVGVAHISFSVGTPVITGQAVYDLPLGTLPDATIAGAVDFVLSEARYFQKRQGN